ncbi:T9SS type A sorting domain-containing protein [Flammeovirga pectinis]|uniref:T9SS type A sorting domain-containing protein n=1 Tax=Flammeovirga pectinis TaxID=2494373 RepID=A0A3Q9FSH6_9BACT|nr:AGE family epimerase/isomerase [Flammeovirga pectinis]AZQ65420.1 T9SS type A sorting domain-containing protein [Flammeovirga pectinis]
MQTKTILIFCALLVWKTTNVYAQYQTKSTFLNDPTEATKFVKGVADFLRTTKDEKGGYYSFVEADGSIKKEQMESWTGGYNLKSFCSQTRVAYTFARAFMLTGDTTYLKDAEHALDFLYEKGWDEEYDGWYFTYNVDADKSFGPPWNENSKWTFQQEYAILGIIAMVDVLGGIASENRHTEWLDKSMVSLYEHVWDSHSTNFGYYENASRRWGNKYGKGFTGTIDGINTHAALLALMTNEEQHNLRYQQLADISRDKLAGNMDAEGVKIGFPENFHSDWSINQDNTGASVGHMLKTAWCLGRAAVYFDDRSYRTAAEEIIDHVYTSNLYDKNNGAPYEWANWKTGVVTDRNKCHWVVEQGFTGPMIASFITNDKDKKERYLQMADESLYFFEQNMISSIGLSHEYVTPGGNPIDGLKANMFKSGFHDAELGFFAYLYGQAYLTASKFSLYYYLTPSEDKVFTLMPLAYPNSQLKISNVELDGKQYANFNGEQNEVSVLANRGGVFKVEFTPTPLTSVLTTAAISKNEKIKVFPTLFSDKITIKTTINGYYTIRIYDMFGNIFYKNLTNTPTTIVENLQKVPKGIYIVNIQSEEINQGFKIIKN